MSVYVDNPAFDPLYANTDANTSTGSRGRDEVDILERTDEDYARAWAAEAGAEFQHLFVGVDSGTQKEVGVVAAAVQSDTHLWIGFRGTTGTHNNIEGAEVLRLIAFTSLLEHAYWALLLTCSSCHALSRR